MRLGNLVFLLALFSALMGCSSKNNWDNYRDGKHLVIEVELTGDESVDRSNLQKIYTLMVQRLYDFGIRDIFAKKEGKDRIILQLPHKTKLQTEIYDLVLNSYKLEFKIVNEDYTVEQLDKSNLPPNIQLLNTSKSAPGNDNQLFAVNKKVLLTGAYIIDAKVTFDKYTERPNVEIEFDKEGAILFKFITGNNIKKRLAMIFDGEVYSAPVIQTTITGGHAILTGNFSDQEAKILAICLRQGAYPASVRLIAENRLTEDIWLGSDRDKKH